jgi:hypothetical protein
LQKLTLVLSLQIGLLKNENKIKKVIVYGGTVVVVL